MKISNLLKQTALAILVHVMFTTPLLASLIQHDVIATVAKRATKRQLTSDTDINPREEKKTDTRIKPDIYTQEFKMWKEFLTLHNLSPITESIATVRLGEMYLLGLGTKHELCNAACTLMEYYDIDGHDISLSPLVAHYMAQIHLGRYNTGQYADWLDYQQARIFLEYCAEDSEYIDKEVVGKHPDRTPGTKIKVGPKQLGLHALLELSKLDILGRGIDKPDYDKAYERFSYCLSYLDKDDPENAESLKQIDWIRNALDSVGYFVKMKMKNETGVKVE